MYENIPISIKEKIGYNLHQNSTHPVGIISKKIRQFLSSFKFFDNLDPVVSVENNFDKLLIPQDHISRSTSDSYYLNKDFLLRTHTSAHQWELLHQGENQFLVVGDVYRKDEIDKNHYPVFHQMEGVRLFTKKTELEIVEDLKNTLSSLLKYLFKSENIRFIDSYFPFTNPSFEVEINYQGKWLEVLGCGVIHKEILKSLEKEEFSGWAFGLGLERLAMVLFDIPDIRYFWSKDPRFLDQFKNGEISKFVPYSKYEACYKDISFWIEKEFSINEFYEIVRSVAGNLVETIECIDRFQKNSKKSECYRITYRHFDRSLTNAEIDALQNQIRIQIQENLPITLR